MSLDHALVCSVEDCESPYFAKGLCRQHYNRAWDMLHRRVRLRDRPRDESIRAKERAYEAAHRTERLAKSAAYSKLHPEKTRAHSEKYRKAHPDRVHATVARWAKAHADAVRTSKRNRRLRLGVQRRDGFKLGAGEWEAIMASYGQRCAYCGKRSAHLTMDHVVPVSKGGLHIASNIVPACKPCNSRKGARLPLRPVNLVLL